MIVCITATYLNEYWYGNREFLDHFVIFLRSISGYWFSMHAARGSAKCVQGGRGVAALRAHTLWSWKALENGPSQAGIGRQEDFFHDIITAPYKFPQDQFENTMKLKEFSAVTVLQVLQAQNCVYHWKFKKSEKVFFVWAGGYMRWVHT